MGSTVSDKNYGFQFENSYVRLPGEFYSHENPIAVSAPSTIVFNNTLAKELDLDMESLQKDCASVFSGNKKIPGTETIAQAYAGHQYGHLTMLGDGRAILLGEHLTKKGQRYDLQLKGSGQTVYSRRGDGRAALGPMLREYIVSEAMHALGIPSTRSLAVVSTGETVYRDEMLAGAVLARVASSHIRVGTFEYAYHYGMAYQKPQLVKLLADYTIARHYPDSKEQQNPYLSFLKEVSTRQALLIAKWMSFGFIHGVMNTDNMAVSGETIDYGPCAFMDAYSSDKVFSSIDSGGRYSYQNQPVIAQWNIARLAECLLPLLDDDKTKATEKANEVLTYFMQQYHSQWLRVMRNKLGIYNEEEADFKLIDSLLKKMQESHADFTNTFRTIHLISNQTEWHLEWKARLSRQKESESQVQSLMHKSNPYVIPRNHRIEEVIRSAYQNNFAPLYKMIEAMRVPFEENTQFEEYTKPPTDDELVTMTFCGT